MNRTLVTGCNRRVELQPHLDPNCFNPVSKIDSAMCSTPGVLRAAGTIAAVTSACAACPFSAAPVQAPPAAAPQPTPTATPTQKMTPRCKISVAVYPAEKGFALAEVCPEGVANGTLVANLLERCGTCARGAAAEAAVAPGGALATVAALEDNLSPPPADEAQEAASSLPAGFYPVLPASHVPRESVVRPEEAHAQRAPVQSVERAQPTDEAVPADFFAGVFNTATPPPTVDALLTAACPWHVAGGSLLGMSKLKTAKHCLRRFYWENVQRLRLRSTTPYQEATGPENAPPAGASTSSGAAGGPSQGQSRKGKQDRIDPLALGTLVHACLGRFYVTANVQELWSAAEAVKAYYPELALETRRLVAFYLRRFNAEEAATWDVRAVEHESRYYWPARKVAGKRRCLCTSARHDGVYRKRAPGQACIPIGERAPDGVRLHELKTTGSLTGGRIRGFFQNAQIMMNLLAYTYGHSVRVDGTVLAESSAELLGSCDTVTVTHIGKNKAMGNLDISRNDYVVPEARIFGFRDDLADWLFEELFARLFSEHWLEPETWRKDWICSDVYYQGWICPYTQLCEAEEVNWEVNYYQRPDDGFRPEALELPAKLEKQRAARMSASEQIAEGK